jgi:hypothetical protein
MGQRFNLTVGLQQPVCFIIAPGPGQTVTKKLSVTGTATKGTLDLLLVAVRIDDGPWMNASGTSSWRLELDTKTLSNGRHTIQARAFDGELDSDVASVEVSVLNEFGSPLPPKGGGASLRDSIALFAVVASIAALAVIICALALRKRQGGARGHGRRRSASIRITHSGRSKNPADLPKPQVVPPLSIDRGNDRDTDGPARP